MAGIGPLVAFEIARLVGTPHHWRDSGVPLWFSGSILSHTTLFRLLFAGTKLPQLDYVPDGEIVLIRFIRSDCKLDIFGEKFQVAKDLAYSYVKAVIVTSIHTLQVYRDSELVDTFDYHLTA